MHALVTVVLKKLVLLSPYQYFQFENLRLFIRGCFLSLEFHRWPIINVFKCIKYNSVYSTACFINCRSWHTIIPILCFAKQMVWNLCPNNRLSLGEVNCYCLGAGSRKERSSQTLFILLCFIRLKCFPAKYC